MTRHLTLKHSALWCTDLFQKVQGWHVGAIPVTLSVDLATLSITSHFCNILVHLAENLFYFAVQFISLRSFVKENHQKDENSERSYDWIEYKDLTDVKNTLALDDHPVANDQKLCEVDNTSSTKEKLALY